MCVNIKYISFVTVACLHINSNWLQKTSIRREYRHACCVRPSIVEVIGKDTKEKCADKKSACFCISWPLRLNFNAIQAVTIRKIAKYLGVGQPTGCTLRSHESCKHEILQLLENSPYTIFEKMRVNAKVFFVIFALFVLHFQQVLKDKHQQEKSRSLVCCSLARVAEIRAFANCFCVNSRLGFFNSEHYYVICVLFLKSLGVWSAYVSTCSVQT